MIEFFSGDNYCCWNGILMSPQNHLKILGVEEELVIDNSDIIISDGIIYSDLPFGEVFIELGENLDDPDDDTIVFDKDFLRGLEKIKPYSDFIVDHPKFNRELYDEFYKDLENYHNNKKKYLK